MVDRMPEILGVFDTETTGVNVENARIVTAFIGTMGRNGEWIDRWEWLIAPDVEIPEGAQKVHGISTQHAREHGEQDRALAVFKIMQRLDILHRQGIPIVVYNAPYDFSLLDREVRRYYPGIREWSPRICIDPLVIDRAVHQKRRGTGMRKLTAVAPIWGVPLEANAHDAAADCLMAGRLAWKMLEHPSMQKYHRIEEIHTRQIELYVKQMEGLRDYFKQHDRDWQSITYDWPIISYDDPAADA